jgi:hypothetical protein
MRYLLILLALVWVSGLLGLMADTTATSEDAPQDTVEAAPPQTPAPAPDVPTGTPLQPPAKTNSLFIGVIVMITVVAVGVIFWFIVLRKK